MNSIKSKRKLNKGNLVLISVIILLIVMVCVVVRGFWYKRQCDLIYNEVNTGVVRSGMKIYAEYEGQKVEIASPNINRVVNSVTNPLVLFTSVDKMPEAEPIILEFGDELRMEIYPGNNYEVFVKHVNDKKTKYYTIENTCSFKQLKKIISLDEWSHPNILIED